jgi:hypothetical protein
LSQVNLKLIDRQKLTEPISLQNARNRPFQWSINLIKQHHITFGRSNTSPLHSARFDPFLHR